jgi:CubicO group peptidase (beta-lactamase class C family)
LTQGYLLGEVIRRITGTTVGEFFAREIAGPLKADFQIRIGSKDDQRIAYVVADAGEIDIPEGAMDTIAARSAAYSRRSALIANTHEWRRAEVPSSNGHGNARSSDPPRTRVRPDRLRCADEFRVRGETT